jgi:hypothetical protein
LSTPSNPTKENDHVAATFDTAKAEPSHRARWTALSISSGGAWGVAAGVTEAGARLAAVAACKAKLVGPDACAGRVSTAKGGWHQAFACSVRHFTVSGVNQHGVGIIAADEEAEIKIATGFGVPACRLLVTVMPDGLIEQTGNM